MMTLIKKLFHKEPKLRVNMILVSTEFRRRVNYITELKDGELLTIKQFNKKLDALRERFKHRGDWPEQDMGNNRYKWVCCDDPHLFFYVWAD